LVFAINGMDTGEWDWVSANGGWGRMAEIKSHRDLRVWTGAMDLAQTIYELAKTFPAKEEYRLTSQMIRAAISIPANIAEGHMRGTRKDYANFISIARGSTAELETLLLLAERARLGPAAPIGAALNKAEDIGRMLTKLHQRLLKPNPQHRQPA
jgi:four helix bundle protein